MSAHERELLLLRHGRAEPPHAGSDFARPLTDPGKRDVERVGLDLQRRGWLPDAVAASPAVRTKVTAEKALGAGGRGTDALTIDERIYEASTGDLLDVIGGFGQGPARVMLVGHNPGISELLAFVSRQSIALLPGMLARLALPAAWGSLSSGCATLLDLVDPRTLPEGFPFPAPGSDERRSRPAYYYVQSGVVPYRHTTGGIEIMIVGSSKKKRWGMPKGCITPGLTPQQSAAKEAREEAGVEGEVGGASLGTFGYEKWGARVTCEFYPMLVTTVVDEAQWEERHRGRAWVSPEAAIEKLGRDGFKQMVRTLASRLLPQ